MTDMNPVLTIFTQDVALTGDIQTDMVTLLTHHGATQTIGHSIRVAAEAKRLASHWGLNEGDAEIGGWLHDISAIVPPAQRIPLAEELGLEILSEEREVPMIIHQKLSAAIAQDIFGINDPAILSAIGCHTTLKQQATTLDKVVFIADKLEWDQEDEPPYLTELLIAMEQSLDHAVFCYVDYQWQRRGTLLVVHPWLADAHRELSEQLQ